jgi:hypothetical protein
MRFRHKFFDPPWAFASLPVFFALSIFDIRRFPPIWIAVVISFWALLELFAAVVYLSLFWELDGTSLRYHWLWNKKEIAWPEVRLVGRLGFAEDNVAIYFGHEIEDYGSLIAKPKDREKFISLLRAFAPQAKFDD